MADLFGVWESIHEVELARRWRVPAVHAYAEIGSTNDRARRLADEGADVGTVVIADRQTAGRGRAGRPWSAAAGQSLLLSIVGPAIPAARAATLPLHIGVALADAIDPLLAGRRAMVKWPNDLLIDGRKCAGILCEQSWVGVRPGNVIVGIGVNVLQAADDFPEPVRRSATSISASSGRIVTRAKVADRVIPSVVEAVRRAADDGYEDDDVAAALAERLRDRDALLGRPVEVTDAPDAPALNGVAMGVAPDGALLVSVAGALRKVRAGTVRPTDGRFRAYGEAVE